MGVIEDRVRHRPPGSYTSQLLAGGADLIGAKLCEEARELAEAARTADDVGRRKAVVLEAADLLYHTFVLLGFCGAGLPEVEAELARRFGVSGLEEKATRR
jgi:phosphoribosyl-ATP pyrophosphohydrolase